MHEAPMPAVLPIALPRADATSSLDAEASKGMRMAQAKAIASGITLVSKFFNPMSAEQKAVYDARQSFLAWHSDEELDCSTDLLESTLALDPAVASAVQAGITATQNGVKTQGASSNVAHRKMPRASLEVVRCESRLTELASAIAARIESDVI
jgi:hypothetical protein